MISQEQLTKVFEYRNGHLIWRIDLPKKFGLKNTCAGYSDISNGNYRMITINGKKRQLHRLVYLYHYGAWPDRVYHLDGNPFNNKIENLTTKRSEVHELKLVSLPTYLRSSNDISTVFDYKVGELYWKRRSALGRGAAGYKAGYVDNHSGIKVVNYRGRRYQLHRLIYLYHLNERPRIIYFMDGNKLNTKIQNLSDIEMNRIEYPNGDFEYLIA